jgi:hypothetical protein
MSIMVSSTAASIASVWPYRKQTLNHSLKTETKANLHEQRMEYMECHDVAHATAVVERFGDFEICVLEKGEQSQTKKQIKIILTQIRKVLGASCCAASPVVSTRAPHC